MKYNTLIITVAISTTLTCNIALAETWNTAKLSFIQTIAGKDYKAEVKLLRPQSYFVEQNVGKIGDILVLDLPEMGINNQKMQITSIEPYAGIAAKDVNGKITYKQIDEINWDNKKYRPVTATFARYATEVYTYKFKNSQTGVISTINATPNHPFYVINKHEYVPIEKVTSSDNLLSETGETVKLLCNNGNQSNCGIKYNIDNKPTLVYNFEVYQLHRYYVTDKNNDHGILVHNDCFKDPFENNNFLDLVPQEYVYSSNTKLYRVDTRSPDQIIGSQIGFAGTISDNNAVSLFGNKTVFSSSSKGGVMEFAASRSEIFPGQKLFLYEIDASDLAAISFAENYQINRDLFVQSLSKNLYNGRKVEFSRFNTLKKNGKQWFITNKLEPKIRTFVFDAAIPTNEVHIFGPVPYTKITFLEQVL